MAENAGRAAAKAVTPFGGSETARLVETFDWAATGLGPLVGWPPVRRATVQLILRSPVPIVTLWGEEGIMIYNDAYSGFAGGRHPRLFGSRVREGWPEVATFNDHVMRTGLAGGTLAYRDQELVLHRSGRPEPVWMNLDYSPIIGEAGAPVGVIAVVVETTEKVLAERRQRETAAALARLNRELEQRVAERTAERDRVWRNSRDLIVVLGADGIFSAVNPAWTEILGHDPAEVVGRSYLEFVLPEDAARTQGGLESAAAQRDLTSFENRYRHRDGSERWISWNTAVEGAVQRARATAPGPRSPVSTTSGWPGASRQDRWTWTMWTGSVSGPRRTKLCRPQFQWAPVIRSWATKPSGQSRPMSGMVRWIHVSRVWCGSRLATTMMTSSRS